MDCACLLVDVRGHHYRRASHWYDLADNHTLHSFLATVHVVGQTLQDMWYAEDTESSQADKRGLEAVAVAEGRCNSCFVLVLVENFPNGLNL